VNTQANLEAIRDRIGGKAPTRMRAAAMAGALGVSVAVTVYRVLREPNS
jgi:hypothetical protein